MLVKTNTVHLLLDFSEGEGPFLIRGDFTHLLNLSESDSDFDIPDILFAVPGNHDLLHICIDGDGFNRRISGLQEKVVLIFAYQ